MSVVNVLYIGDSHEEDMNDLAEHFFSYWEDMPADAELSDVFPDVTVGSLKTVGDAKKLGVYALAKIFYAIIDHGTPFWNMMRCIPEETMMEVYGKVLDCFEDSQAVKVLFIHM